jgi:hypothetical protein
MAEDQNIEELLTNWFEAKQNLYELEKRCDKYKLTADRIMNMRGEDTLKTRSFKLTKTDMERETLSKKDVPKDIWNAYAKVSSFSTFRLTPIKTKVGAKRSPRRKGSPR